MTIVHDPSLDMESSKFELEVDTTPFVAPERLVPAKSGLEGGTPTMEADIYAMAIVIYQVLTTLRPTHSRINPFV